MDPFSHIQIVHRQHQGDPEDHEDSTQTIFRRPSFSQQVHKSDSAGYQPRISGRGGGNAPAAPASLANITSGTTFAAAARQAELNAARANRQKAKEAENEYRAPSIEPLALGALRFTKSRRRYVIIGVVVSL